MHKDIVNYIRDKSIYKLNSQYNDVLKIDFKYYLNKVCNTIKHHLNQSPYNNQPLMYHRIYISCLMSLLNQITLNNLNKERLSNRKSRGFKTDDFLNKAFEEERQDSIVLYHLDESMYNYIHTTVNILRSLIVKDLKYLIGSNQPTDSVIQSILNHQGDNLYNVEE